LLNRQEAAGALWNLSFDDRNREAIAAAGGVEALVIYLLATSTCSLFVRSIVALTHNRKCCNESTSYNVCV